MPATPAARSELAPGISLDANDHAAMERALDQAALALRKLARQEPGAWLRATTRIMSASLLGFRQEGREILGTVLEMSLACEADALPATIRLRLSASLKKFFGHDVDKRREFTALCEVQILAGADAAAAPLRIKTQGAPPSLESLLHAASSGSLSSARMALALLSDNPDFDRRRLAAQEAREIATEVHAAGCAASPKPRL